MPSEFQPILNHVAVLVGSVERSAEKLRNFGFAVGPTEKWPGEGTREIYVGESSHRAKLLLMEPYSEGAYLHALNKRGPGLHHIAIDINNLEDFIDSLSGSGWYLHPKSVKSILKQRTAWLARPGVHTLIELQQKDGHQERMLAQRFITEIEIPTQLEDRRLIAALKCPDVVVAKGDHCYLDTELMRLNLRDLL